MNRPMVVWDLDGTLYEDEHHFDYYMKQLTAFSSSPDLLWQDYRSVLKGEHVLRFGRVYDVKQDFILEVENSQVTRAFNWYGQQVACEARTVELNMVDMLSIGDQWWVAVAVAKHHGVTHEQSQLAFRATREYMSTPAYTVTKVLGLGEFLQQTQSHVDHVLLTNSPKLDSSMILSKLGLQDCFAIVKYAAEKPSQSSRHFSAAVQAAGNPSLVISVGDNYENEIAPALALGCKAVYIDRLNLMNKTYPGLLRVASTVEVINALGTLLDQFRAEPCTH